MSSCFHAARDKNKHVVLDLIFTKSTSCRLLVNTTRPYDTLRGKKRRKKDAKQKTRKTQIGRKPAGSGQPASHQPWHGPATSMIGSDTSIFDGVKHSIFPLFHKYENLLITSVKDMSDLLHMHIPNKTERIFDSSQCFRGLEPCKILSGFGSPTRPPHVLAAQRK